MNIFEIENGQSQRVQVDHRRNVDPETIGITVVNCRSCVGKVPELQALIESTETHVIIGSESWLKPEISSEVFSKDLSMFRKDRLK